MSWYSRYLQVYEKSFDEVAFAGIISEVCSNLKQLQSTTPLVTVSIIAYNEEKHLLACLWALSEMKTRYPMIPRTALPTFTVLLAYHFIQSCIIVAAMPAFAG